MENKVCIADTRNQVDDFAVKEIIKQGYEVRRMTLPFGDFALLDNLTYAIDIKSSGGGILELARNVCSTDHQRLKREIKKCAEWNGEICFLIANEDGVNSIDDLLTWKSPTFKSDQYVQKYKYQDKWVTKAVLLKHIKEKDLPNYEKKSIKTHSKGEPMTTLKMETFVKALKTMSQPNHYKKGLTVRFSFIDKNKAGEKIVQILEWWKTKRRLYEK